MIINENGYNKVQINSTEDRTADGTIIKKSLMLNIREDSVEKAFVLYRKLQEKIENREKQPKKIVKKEKKSTIPNCPKCKSPMIIRTNRKTSEAFWSCPSFPLCNGTRPMKKKAEWIPADEDLRVVETQ